MSGTTKKKICWNCEGNVSVHEENCPYCAVYIGPAEPVEEEAVLTAPYQMTQQEEVPYAPYASHGRIDEQTASSDEAPSDLKEMAISTALFSGGAIFFLFGLILLLFSQGGGVSLTWKSDYWYVYFLLSLPMLWFGWKKLQMQDEE